MTLGRAEASPGCFSGQVYASTADADFSTEYGESAPASELWACDWNIALRDGALAFAGAQDGARYIVRHQGTFTVRNPGHYRFAPSGTTPWRLSIDGRPVTDWRRGHGNVMLTAGSHTMLFEYFYEAGNPFELAFSVAAPGRSLVPFTVGQESPYFAPQAVYYAGERRLGDDWRELAEMDGEEIRILEKVHFETDSASLRKDDRSEAVLYAVATVLNEHPEIKRVEVQGHTDDQGSDSYNVDLSQRRAVTVRRWLVNAGIAPHRLSAHGFGKSRPIAGNQSDAGRAENRRVQFVIMGPESEATAKAGDQASADGERDIRVLIAGPMAAPSDLLADLLPPVVGAYERYELETKLHLRGLSAAAFYRGPGSDEVIVVVATALSPVLLRERFPETVAGLPASSKRNPILFASERTGLLVGNLAGQELETFVKALRPRRLRASAEQRVDALAKKLASR